MSPSDRAERIAVLTAELTGEVEAGLSDGAIAALAPDVARRLLAVGARCYAIAAEEGAEPPRGDDLTPTESVVLATAALRAHDLNPFDLALWFSRDAKRSGAGDTRSTS